MAFRIIFWLFVLAVLVYFIVRWAQSESVINNQASGLSSVETEDNDESDEKEVVVPRVAGMPVAFQPQEGIRELAAQLREKNDEDGTQDTPVYLGDHSSAVPVHLK